MPSTVKASTSLSLVKRSSLSWRFTKVMNMSDLSRDDDFLSHLLVEKLGTGGIPLLVHKMDPSRRLPKTDANDLLQIVRRLVVARGQPTTAVREAVDDLLLLSPIRYYLRSYTQKQINAFATHASRYLELYLPSGSIEIAHTSRYAHRTGKSELCILAARALATGSVITELKGSMADLTDEEDRELKRATSTGLSGIRRDFSVIHSKQLKKNHLFLGPARFVNHDCDHNVELFREGRYITFRVLKPIGVGEEVTAHYGDDYFGRNNRHCLCQSCEKAGRGGYAPEDGLQPSSSSDSDSDASESSSSDTEKDAVPLNVNERRTRRGVYAVMPEDKVEREASTAPKIELDVEDDNSLLSISRSPSSAVPLGLVTPDSILPSRASSISSSLTSLSAETDQILRKVPKRMIPLKPSARTQILITPEPQRSLSGVPVCGPPRQLPTPPLSADTTIPTTSVRSSARLQARVPVKPDQDSQISRTATPTTEAVERRKLSKSRKSEAEAQESRVLRPRPSLPNTSESASGGKSSSKVEGPSKPAKGSKKAGDKRLPTCSTCEGVLPVISVDSEIVWGLEGFNEKGKGKGKHKSQEKRECPRCMRHYAIYNVPWPNRIPANGGTAFDPLPRRESSRPMDMSISSRDASHSTTSNDRSASVSSSLKTKSKAGREEAEEDERPSKRRKLDDVVRGRTQMSTKSRSLLGVGKSRCGRARVPSRKLRDSVPPRSIAPERLKEAMEEGSPVSPDMNTSEAQPQCMKYRLPTFGRKVFSMVVRRSRAERATARTRIRAKLDKEAKRKDKRASHGAVAEHSSDEVDADVSKKRSRDSETDERDERSHKRSRSAESDEEFVHLSPSSSRRPSMGIPRSRYNGASNLLSHAPNPLLFARRKWVPVTLPEPEPEHDSYHDYSRVGHSSQSSTDDETDGPVTPEDNDEPFSPIIAPGSGEGNRGASFKFIPRTTAFAGRAMKPSPVNFAMKRWSALSDVPKSGPLITEPIGSLLGDSTPLSVDGLDTSDFFEADSREEIIKPSLVHSTAGKSLTYMPSRIWEASPTGHQHRTIPEFPDSSRFVLRRKASFGSSQAVGSATDDSENTVEQLISEDSPPSSDASGTDDSQEQFETAMTVLENAVRLLVSGSSTDSVGNAATLQCTAVSFSQSTEKENCLSKTTQTAAFVTPSLLTPRLVKAGWDMDTEL